MHFIATISNAASRRRRMIARREEGEPSKRRRRRSIISHHLTSRKESFERGRFTEPPRCVQAKSFTTNADKTELQSLLSQPQPQPQPQPSRQTSNHDSFTCQTSTHPIDLRLCKIAISQYYLDLTPLSNPHPKLRSTFTCQRSILSIPKPELIWSCHDAYKICSTKPQDSLGN